MIKSVKRVGRRGKGLGTERPSKWRTRDFKSIRVPISLAGQLLEIARYLEGQAADEIFRVAACPL